MPPEYEKKPVPKKEPDAEKLNKVFSITGVARADIASLLSDSMSEVEATKTAMSISEDQMVEIARHMESAYVNTVYWLDLQSAFKKIIGVLPEEE